MICHSENMNPMNKLGTFYKYGFNAENKIPWENEFFLLKMYLYKKVKYIFSKFNP